MPIEIPKENWPGAVQGQSRWERRRRTAGREPRHVDRRRRTHPALPATSKSSLPPSRPRAGDHDRKPDDWSPALSRPGVRRCDDPGAWARGGEIGRGRPDRPDAQSERRRRRSTSAAECAVRSVTTVLEATGLPLIVLGPGQAEMDNELIVAVAEAAKGERLRAGPLRRQELPHHRRGRHGQRSPRQSTARPWMSTWPSSSSS